MKTHFMDVKGIIGPRNLPDKNFDELWDRIIISEKTKTRLIAQILLEFTIRKDFSFSEIPLHGLILLVGPPGTGKTSLAKGMASKAAQLLKGNSIKFIEVEPHDLTSSALGKSQREIRNLLKGTISEHASHSPTIVLLDEVETLAAARSKLSLEANPIDVHRATDAMLAGLDELAHIHRDLLFIATSNYENAIDDAFISRADLVERIEKPSPEACEAILKDSLDIMAKKWGDLKKLSANGSFKKLAEETHGLDGRQIRKAVLHACTYSKEVAMDPNLLTIEALSEAFQKARTIKI